MIWEVGGWKHSSLVSMTETLPVKILRQLSCIMTSNLNKEIANILITHRQLNLASLCAARYTNLSTTQLPVLPFKPNYHSDLLWVRFG